MTTPPSAPSGPRAPLSRRHALGGLAAVTVGLPVLAACGGGDEAGRASDPTTPSTSPPSSPSESATPTEPPVGPLTTTADIEVGGGTIFPDDGVVVTQPTAGEFRAFSTTCTHQGCPVTEVTDGAIFCPCHSSTFSLENGDPLGGPASSPLEPVDIAVEGDQITLA